MSKNPQSLPVPELKRELSVALAVGGGSFVFSLMVLALVGATRGRLLFSPLGLLVAIVLVALAAQVASEVTKVKELRGELARRRSLPKPEPVLLPEEEKLKNIQRTLQELPEATAPDQVALIRLSEEAARDLVALIARHREQGTEAGLEPQAALRELTRLEAGVLAGGKVAAEAATPADAIARASQITFDSSKPELS